MPYGSSHRPVPRSRTVRAKKGTTVPDIPKVSKCGPLVNFIPAIRKLLLEVGHRMGVRSALEHGSYDTLDTETTGFDLTTSKIWQVGAVKFDDHKCVEQLDLILSIEREDYDRAFLPKDREPTEADIAKRNELLEMVHLDWDRILRKGVLPLHGIVELAKFLAGRNDRPIVGNNVRSFDMPRIMMMCSQIAGRPVQLPMDRVLDLGVIVKAAQCNASMLSDETPGEFMNRIAGIRAKAIYWSVDYMVKQLNLPIQLDTLHDAVADCKTLAVVIDYIMNGGLTKDRADYWVELIHGTSRPNPAKGVAEHVQNELEAAGT